MKKYICLLVLLVVGLPCFAEQPANLSVGYHHWRSKGFGDSPLLSYLTHPGPERFGVWVSVWLSDPTIEALKITLNYQNQQGWKMVRTQTVQRFYGTTPAWTAILFEVGEIQVVSILVSPLIVGGPPIKVDGDKD